MRLLLLCGLVFLGACSNAVKGDIDATDTTALDLPALFAPATEAERESILADWATRPPVADSVQLLAEDTATVPGSAFFRFRLYSHKVDGNRHYFMSAVPEPAPAGIKVLLQCHGGDQGMAFSTLLLILMYAPDVGVSYAHVVPVFRSEALQWINGQEYVAEGAPSPWNRDVDDALSSVRAFWQSENWEDTTSYLALGFSRGGGVALLASIRDPRIAGVVDYFGPADFQGPFVQEKIAQILAGEDPELPGSEFLDSAVVQPLQNGSLSMAEARRELVLRSPAAFADRLPPIQIHHGDADMVVPVSQSLGLWDSLQTRGDTSGSELHVYAGGEHDPTSLEGSLDRTFDFLAGIAGSR